MSWQEEYGFTSEEWQACLKVLNILKDKPFQNPDNQSFKTLVTKLHKQAKKENSKFQIQELSELDQVQILLAQTYRTAKKQHRKAQAQDQHTQTINTLKQSQITSNALSNQTLYDDAHYQEEQIFKQIPKKIKCYCCHSEYDLVHHFYHRLCPSCAEFNYKKRFEGQDLNNKNFIITGARVKVGYATCLKLLRLGANVIATTRFPALALEQLQQEEDYKKWHDKVIIYGLDLRNLIQVEQFIQFANAHFPWCDGLINNAAQTIQYTNEYYSPIILKEQLLLESLSPELKKKCLPNLTPLANDQALLTNDVNGKVFALNRFGQPVDQRLKNSWNSTLEEISTFELLEVNFINQISPYILIKELKPLMQKSPAQYKYITNVTSSEGQFSYAQKTVYHPHTNMTKAAFNMLTRTSAQQYFQDNILMNSVDVGWISTGANEVLRAKHFEKAVIPPLDCVDGAARILHPIFLGMAGNAVYGNLFKNYIVAQW